MRRLDSIGWLREEMEVKHLLAVGLGGMIGALIRYKLGGVILHHTEGARFPWSTFAINVFGCLVIGFLAALVVHRDSFSETARLFFFTGLLGGFTTFSAFGLETFYLLRRGEFLIAAGYVAASALFGVAAVGLGWKLVGGRG